MLAQWLAVRDLLAGCHRSPGVHLFEEGVLQRLWTIGLRGGHDTSARLWRNLDPARRTDLVVVLDLPATEAAARLRGRPSRHSRVQALGSDAMLDELVRGERLLDTLVAGCPVPVVRVGADVAPDARGRAGRRRSSSTPGRAAGRSLSRPRRRRAAPAPASASR